VLGGLSSSLAEAKLKITDLHDFPTVIEAEVCFQVLVERFIRVCCATTENRQSHVSSDVEGHSCVLYILF
jgi:hypothetical protein